MSDGLVKDSMTISVVSVSSDTGLSDARKMMTEHKVRRLPVVDNGELVGIVSFTDVLEAKLSASTTMNVWELSQLVLDMKVKDVMATEVYSIDQNASVADATRLMLEQKISGVPVTDNGKLVGMITESDLFRLLAIEGRYLSIHQKNLCHRCA
ncbi:MAG: CBS domain-containing protein [Pseudomonadales bacterium]|jgi:CBS domain-containing protein